MVQHVLLPEQIPELGCSASFSCSPLEQLFAQLVNPSEQIPALHPEAAGNVISLLCAYLFPIPSLCSGRLWRLGLVCPCTKQSNYS